MDLDLVSRMRGMALGRPNLGDLPLEIMFKIFTTARNSSELLAFASLARTSRAFYGFWRTNFQQMLREILRRGVPRLDLAEKLLADQARTVWTWETLPSIKSCMRYAQGIEANANLTSAICHALDNSIIPKDLNRVPKHLRTGAVAEGFRHLTHSEIARLTNIFYKCRTHALHRMSVHRDKILDPESLRDRIRTLDLFRWMDLACRSKVEVRNLQRSPEDSGNIRTWSQIFDARDCPGSECSALERTISWLRTTSNRQDDQWRHMWETARGLRAAFDYWEDLGDEAPSEEAQLEEARSTRLH